MPEAPPKTATSPAADSVATLKEKLPARETTTPVPRHSKNGKHLFSGILKQILGKLLLIDIQDINAKINFDNYGIDSLIIQDAVFQLERYLGRAVEPSIFLDYPCVDALAVYLQIEYGDCAERLSTSQEKPDAASAEPAPLSPRQNLAVSPSPPVPPRLQPATASSNQGAGPMRAKLKERRLAILRDIAVGKLPRLSGLQQLQELEANL